MKISKFFLLVTKLLISSRFKRNNFLINSQINDSKEIYLKPNY